jgi:hypothetical protein
MAINGRVSLRVAHHASWGLAATAMPAPVTGGFASLDQLRFLPSEEGDKGGGYHE